MTGVIHHLSAKYLRKVFRPLKGLKIPVIARNDNESIPTKVGIQWSAWIRDEEQAETPVRLYSLSRSKMRISYCLSFLNSFSGIPLPSTILTNVPRGSCFPL